MNSKRILFHPEALAEAKAAFAWYAQRSHGASESFLREIDRGIEKINQDPLARSEFKPGFRRYLLRIFPFSLIYTINDSGIILIIAVAHARRKPGYWKIRS